MSKTIETGKQGEDQATSFLQNRGYEILARNWRYKHLEIDIIARDTNELVIIEVKSRSTDRYGSPEHFVTKEKQRKLIKAAHAYITEKELEMEVRFDIVSITRAGNKTEHIKNAFYAGLG